MRSRAQHFWLGLAAVAAVFALAAGVGVRSARAAAAARFAVTEFHNQFSEAEAAGQLNFPGAVSVNNDEASSFYADVYVADNENNRIDRFSSTGEFQLAWGWGVADGAGALQVCTVSCHRGIEHVIATGAVPQPLGVAVDGNQLSGSVGDVYVAEGSIEGGRIEKFGPSGEFLLTFGGDVNKTNGSDICLAGEECQRGRVGSAPGEFNQGFAVQKITPNVGALAIGPAGRVYVGDTGRVQVFEPDGAYVETISTAALSATGDITALAVDEAGDVFLKDAGAPGVREFAPGGVESSTQFDSGSTTVTGVTVDPSGFVYVGDRGTDTNFGFHLLKYTPQGKAVGRFAARTVRGGYYEPAGGTESLYGGQLAFGDKADSVYAPEAFAENLSGHLRTNISAVWALPVPPPGPEISAESDAAGPRATLELKALLDPEGEQTSYHFEYVTEAHFDAEGFTGAALTPMQTLAPSLEEEPVSVTTPTLLPETGYHYRLVAENAEGTVTGEDQTATTNPAATIESVYAADVAASSATLHAEINPQGSETEYALEYGPTTQYGSSLTGTLAAADTGTPLALHLQGLSAHTQYYYRFTAHNALGEKAGQQRSFLTQREGAEASLPDGRAWELVSPPDKNGALIAPFTESAGLTQAADDGGAVSYGATESLGERGAAGKNGLTEAQIFATRSSHGWINQNITLPRGLACDECKANEMASRAEEYVAFSGDLSEAIVEPLGVHPLFSPEATERTLYLHPVATSIFQPLVDASDVTPPGAPYGGAEVESQLNMHFLASTPDLKHVLLDSPGSVPLTEEASVPPVCPEPVRPDKLCASQTQVWNLYEAGEGKLQLVDILPDGEPLKLILNDGATPISSAYAGDSNAVVAHTISSDGRWIAWSTGIRNLTNGIRHLYVRDMLGQHTYQVGGEHAIYQRMSAEGGRVYFLEDGELYVYETADAGLTDLTSGHGAAESSAGVQDSILGASADGTAVYFVATGVLAEQPGAKAGAENLYESRYSAGHWSISFIAALSKGDSPNWTGCEPQLVECSVDLHRVTASVSPSGRYLEFMSELPLAGYDNRDAVTGAPDVEMYLFDSAAGGALHCVSCDPTGARPTGLADNQSTGTSPIFDPAGAWLGHSLAATVPGWEGPDVGHEGVSQGPQYQPRFLSDEGRLFFDSASALSPRDVNGRMDVYEYEPPGVGDCATSNTGFSAASEGCVRLISSGTAASDSVFMDASASGNDVFFETASRLSPADHDTTYDVYDAHVCTSAVPCLAAPVSPPACNSSDACKSAPTPQPEGFGAPASQTFSGSGNPTPVPPRPSGPSPRPRTRVQNLRRALTACHKRHAAARRRCERAVRARYGRAADRQASRAKARGR